MNIYTYYVLVINKRHFVVAVVFVRADFGMNE